jgi:hypothetical protein
VTGPRDPSQDDLRIYRTAKDDARITDRQVDEMIGLCKGVLCDGTVTEGEAEFISIWLDKNRHASSTWPGSYLYRRINAMLLDRTLSVSEQGELIDLLQGIAGSPLSFEERAENTAAESIFDLPTPEIVFLHRSFCRTGRLAFGSEADFKKAISMRGGRVEDQVPTGRGYLIVGTYGSPEWKHSSFGNKIATAMQRRTKGPFPGNVAIVKERDWIAALEKAPPLPAH